MKWPLSKLLPWALHVANSDPLYPKDAVYRAKDRILYRYGTADGCDVQRIEKPCWSCEGTGGLYEPGGCYKCDGDGVFQTVLVLLQRYRLGPYVFHTPKGSAKVRYGRILDDEAGRVHIEGYVQHERHRHAQEAGLWLVLFWNPRSLWFCVKHATLWPAWTPFVLAVRTFRRLWGLYYHLRHALWTLRHKLGIERDLPF